MEKKRYDAVVIGAGVTAAPSPVSFAVPAEICVLEKGEDVCTGTSKANSAIVHGGFDAKTGSLKAKMNVLGNRMMTQVAEELDVPFRRNGAFVLCFDENDMPALKELYERGVTNGVETSKFLPVTKREKWSLRSATRSSRRCSVRPPASYARLN